MAKKPAKTERPGLKQLLQDIPESEHHLRHPEAFEALVTDAGFKLAKLEHKFEVQDPD